MIRWPATIYVAVPPVNLHASFDTLAGMVRAILCKEPRSEAVFVFHNRARTLMEELARIHSTDVVLQTDEAVSRELRIRCIVRPEKAGPVLLERLGLRLPERLRGPRVARQDVVLTPGGELAKSLRSA